ncbi:MAG: hypothetical protein MUC33_22795 [Desulfobacterales bacterium]|nr:hypothetical protein [Desulfobacterales bacterium]
METKEAILAYAQSEKAKAGLLMAAQLLEIYKGMPDHERHAAERVLRPLISMIANEVYLSKKMTAVVLWAGVEKSLNTALVLMNSGVLAEATYHVVQAISAVTTIGQRAMQHLMDQKLL